MAKPSDLVRTPPKVLLWGKPGTGKTPFLTSYGKGLQLIDCDNGLRSSITLKDSWYESRQQIDVIQILENNPLEATAWKRMKDTIADIYTQCQRKTYPYEVLGIDSFTVLADYALRHVMKGVGKLNQTPRIQDWGLAIQEVDNLFVWIRAMPIPVIMIFHDREGEETLGETKIVTSEIAIFGRQLPRKIVSYFDEIIRVLARQVGGKLDPYLQTIPDAFTVVRSREALPDGLKTSIGLKELLSKIGWKPFTPSTPTVISPTTDSVAR